MKKLTFIISASILLLAPTQDTQAASFSGLYIGVNAGYEFGNTQNHLYGYTDTSNGYSHIHNMYQHGVTTGLLMGYGWTFLNNWYVGSEIDTSWGTTHGNQVESTLLHDVKRGNSYSVSLRTGKVFDQVLAYAKVGLKSTIWHFSTTVSSGWLGGTGTLDVPDSRSRRLFGLVFGVGVETPLSADWHLGGEFTYTRYASSTTTRFVTTGDGFLFSAYRPSTMDAVIRLTYKL